MNGISINQFRNLPICTNHHSNSGCIAELTRSNLCNFNSFYPSLTLVSSSPKVCIRIYPMSSDSLSIVFPWTPSFGISPKFLLALCLKMAEACKLILFVQSSSFVMQTKPVVSHHFKTSKDRCLQWQANCRISTLT